MSRPLIRWSLSGGVCSRRTTPERDSSTLFLKEGRLTRRNTIQSFMRNFSLDQSGWQTSDISSITKNSDNKKKSRPSWLLTWTWFYLSSVLVPVVTSHVSFFCMFCCCFDHSRAAVSELACCCCCCCCCRLVIHFSDDIQHHLLGWVSQWSQTEYPFMW